MLQIVIIISADIARQNSLLFPVLKLYTFADNFARIFVFVVNCACCIYLITTFDRKIIHKFHKCV